MDWKFLLNTDTMRNLSKLTGRISNNSKSSNLNSLSQQSVKKAELPKSQRIDQAEIAQNIQLEFEEEQAKLELFCPVHSSRIFCHSILIDKLGELTKFIVSSLYNGHSIYDVSELTQMGFKTIQEETDYLIRGGILCEDRKTLTELGLQYGRLLVFFDKLSNGIEITYNAFANIFEPIMDNQYCSPPDTANVLPSNFISILARNDNYANSLNIAIAHIENDIPFCNEIKNSLYTTVIIEPGKSYKRVYIADFCIGLPQKTDDEACVKIAMPCDHIVYRARYKWLNQYRDILSPLNSVYITHKELLTSNAQSILKASKEEMTDDVYIDTVTGKLITGDSPAEPSSDEDCIVLPRRKVFMSLNSGACSEIYLEEEDRKELYTIRYFPYSRMEDQ